MRGISHQYIDGRITLAKEKKKMYMLHLNHPPPCLLAVVQPGSALSLDDGSATTDWYRPPVRVA